MTNGTQGRRDGAGWAAGLLAALVLAVGACSAGPAEPKSAAESGVAQLIALVDAHRASVGCPSLEWHPDLYRVARDHSSDMAQRRFFGHVNPDGQSPFDRLRAAGVEWQGPAGENLGLTPRGARELFQAWLESPSHRVNLEECGFTHHGVAEVDDHWTHIFVSDPSG